MKKFFFKKMTTYTMAVALLVGSCVFVSCKDDDDDVKQSTTTSSTDSSTTNTDQNTNQNTDQNTDQNTEQNTEQPEDQPAKIATITTSTSAGKIGDKVTIEGANLDLIKTVKVGDVEVEDAEITATSIVFTIPETVAVGQQTITLAPESGDALTATITIEEVVEPKDYLIWQGRLFSSTGWPGQKINALAVNEGDVISFVYTTGSAASWGGAFLKNTSWADFYSTDEDKEAYIKYTATGCDVTLTKEVAEYISENGFIFQCYNAEVTKVYVKTTSEIDGIEEFTPTEGVVLWAGLHELNWSNALQVSLADAAEDDKIVVYYQAEDGAEYINFKFCVASENWPALTCIEGTNEYDCVNPSLTETKYEFTLDEENATNIASSGLIVSGENVTVNAVVLVRDLRQ